METELEAMVVRLNGDGTSYINMLDQAKKATADATKDIADLGVAAVTALSAFGATSFLRSAMDMFSQTESATIKLRAAIAVNGGEVETTLRGYQQFATELRNTTGQGNDSTMALLRTAEAMGLTGQAAINAARNAGTLAAGGGVDPEAAIRMTVQLEQGHTRQAMAMTRMVPALRGIRTEAEFLQRTNRLMEVGQGTLTAMMNSTEGVWKRYEQTLKGLTKQFGEVVANAVKPMIIWVTDLLKTFSNLDEGSKKVIVGAAFVAAGILAIGPAIASISKYVMPAVSLMTSGFGIVSRALLFLLNPVTLISGIISGIGVVAAAVFSPIGLAIGAVAAVVGILAIRMGGLKPLWEAIRDTALNAWDRIKVFAGVAWEYIQSKVEAFRVWAEPYLKDFAMIVDAYWGALKAVWSVVANVAVIAWDFINAAVKNAWDYWSAVLGGMLSGAKLTWGDIKDFILSALIAVEFSAKNLGAVFNLAWVTVALEGIKAFDYMKFSFTELRIFATGAVEAISVGWGAMWNNVLFNADQVFVALKAGWAGIKAVALAALDPLDNRSMQDVFNQAGDAARQAHLAGMRERGETVRSFRDVGDAMSGAFIRGEADARRAATAMGLLDPSQTTVELQAEFDRLGDQLGEGWAAFRERRLRELSQAANPNEPLPRAAANLGTQMGSGMNQGFAKEAHKFDAALVGSTEALSRVASYLDRIQTPTNATTIPVTLGQPRLPMVDVPNHSLYMIYAMPPVDVPINLVPPENGHAGLDVTNPTQSLSAWGGIFGDLAEMLTSAHGRGRTQRLLDEIAENERRDRDIEPLAREVVRRNLANNQDVLGALLGDAGDEPIGEVQYFPLAAMLAPQTVFAIPDIDYDNYWAGFWSSTQGNRNLASHADVLGALLGGDDRAEEVFAPVAAVATTQASSAITAERDSRAAVDAAQSLRDVVNRLDAAVNLLGVIADGDDNPLQIDAADFEEDD